MELRESADGLRWAIGRAGAMAVIWAQIAKTASRAVEKTEPDVHLIKQVEQVTKSALEGPTWRFARIPSMGDHGRRRNPCISDLAITALAVIWLQKQPEEPRATCGNAVGPNRRVHEPGRMAAEPLLCQIR